MPTESSDVQQAVEQFLSQLPEGERLPSVAGGLLRGQEWLPFSRYETGSTPDHDRKFLVASLTKPVVATAALMLVEQGLFSLNQRVSTLLPEWNRSERRRITIRQLLCHCSGLPDQLPDNLELRARHASLDDFYELVVKTPLLYEPGAGSTYQSMGYLVLQKIIEKVTSESLPDLLDELLFQPLEMKDTRLGVSQSKSSAEDDAERILLSEDQLKSDGNWNSSYWRNLGAPWGGMISTAADMGKFLAETNKALREDSRVLSKAIVQESIQPQLEFFERMPMREKRFRSWGLGWRHNWKAHPDTFGDLLSANVIGHWGATGCLFWMDLEAQTGVVLLTNRPSDQSRMTIVRLSNMVHARSNLT